MVVSSQDLSMKIAEVAKKKRITQTGIARKIGAPVSQVNRYFKGRGDIYVNQLIRICNAIGIDISQPIESNLKAMNGKQQEEVVTREAALEFLFKQLDEVGQQTYLAQLHWAAKLSKNRNVPKSVTEFVKKQCPLI